METNKLSAIEGYVQEIVTQYKTGYAGEHGYRPALAKLFSSFEDVSVTNDPRRTEHGNPDLVFYKTSNHVIVLGRAEAKDVGIDLDKTAKTEQLKRYAGYERLILTNGLDFIFYQNGNEYARLSIGKIIDGSIKLEDSEYQRLVNEIKSFLELPPESIKSGKRLAVIMGGRARRIRDNVIYNLNSDNPQVKSELLKIHAVMKELLVHDLSLEKFADMYAQTLVYGLFAARYNDPTPEDFSRLEAVSLVPKGNPFLRKFFDHIAGESFDVRLRHIVDELCEVFKVSDIHTLVHKHLRLFEMVDEKDPIIHFYEDFLKEYDPIIRKQMGAYYTPVPVARFIIHQIDDILKKDFDIPSGLKDTSKVVRDIDHGQVLQLRDAKTGRLQKTTIEKRQYHRVQILDPAVGTATFLNEVIKYVADSFKGQEGQWAAYANEELLPRLSGFELMVAPYTVAHLKLGITLQESGVSEIKDRLGVYLTNTLEEGVPRKQDIFSSFGLAGAMSEESQLASEIKQDRPIMIVMGNPPYSGESSNKTDYAQKLVDKYKVEPGGLHKLKEDNSKWINDDYVKFIAFAEDMIQKNGEGVLGFITNNGYLSNPTFRGMRWHLANTFDKIYILDLHGDTRKKETAPDGSKDENVFDIIQGVSIVLAVKNGKGDKSLADVFHADFFGTRKQKFERLSDDISWNKLTLDDKFLFFTNRDSTGHDDFYSGVGVNELFNFYSTGILTKNDKVAVTFTEQEIWNNVTDFAELSPSDLRLKYGLKKDSRDWALDRAKADIQNSYDQNNIVDVTYRPFDKRKTYYTGKPKGFMAYSQMKVMGHMFKHDNIALVTGRQGQAVGAMQWNLAFVADDITDLNIFYRGGGTAFPLYLYAEGGTKTTNFHKPTLDKLTANLHEQYSPIDIMDYIYAVLHSPKYRNEYKEFLKSDFPRIPVPANDSYFRNMCQQGAKLRQIHLLRDPTLENLDTTFPEAGNNLVDSIKHTGDRVYINDSQYFGNVPLDVWEFHVGGYQPAQKWLKDRKGKSLTSSEINTYQQILKALSETISVMQAID